MKIALGIEYNGKQYCGWQRQEKVSSVQEKLEKALSFGANCCSFKMHYLSCAMHTRVCSARTKHFNFFI